MADEDLALESPKGGRLLKLILIVMIVLILLAGAAVALRFFAPGLIPGWGEKPVEVESEKKSDSKGIQPIGTLFPMKSFIVNLADQTGRRYLKLTLSLELDAPELKAEVEMRTPQIRDAILVLLSSKAFEDINTIEGKMSLRNQIINRCNTYLSKGAVRNVYFSEFVVQ